MAHESGNQSRGHWDTSPNGAEAWVLIDALLENRLSDNDRKRLEQLVIEQPAIARMYVRVVHFWCSLPLHVGKVQHLEVMMDDAGADINSNSEIALADTMILPAIRNASGADLNLDAQEDQHRSIDPPLKFPSIEKATPTRVHRLLHSQALRRGGLAAAILITFGSLILALWPKATPAVLTATAAASFDGSATSPGAKLSNGQAFSLYEGAVELTFDSGAVVVVTAPSRFHIVDRNTLALDSGCVAAHVPPSAMGFKVLAPSLSVFDRGTNFGVRTINADIAAEVDVFDGKVDATALDSVGHATGNELRVIAHQAVCSSTSAGSTLVSTPYVPDAFPRDISAIQMSLDWHGTGAGVPPGSTDPQWTLASVPGDPDWTPRPATVVQALPSRYPGNLPNGQWISTSGTPAGASEGDYVYRTSVDLTGYNPATAEVVAQVAVDQGIADIYINGVHAWGKSMLMDDPNGPIVPVQVTLPGKLWHNGVNQVEVAVKNLPEQMPQGNYAGLQLIWKATASPIVHR